MRASSAAFALLLSLVGTAFTANPEENTPARRRTQTEVNKQIAIDFVKAGLIDFDVDAAEALIGPNYIQHNPGAPTGPQPFLDFIPSFRDVGLITKTKRVLAEGDLVVFHGEYQNADIFGFGPKVIAFDVFRVEDGLVDEHWDNLQTKPGMKNLSGRSMLGGRTKIKDVKDKKLERNKKVVMDFVEEVFMDGDISAAPKYISAETYKNRNPNVGDGLDTFMDALTFLNSIGLGFVYDEVHLVVAEGNYVFTASEGSQNGTAMAYFDLFRVNKGLIVEHWDVISEIPPDDQFLHGNGKF